MNHVEKLTLRDIRNVFQRLNHDFISHAYPIDNLARNQDSEEENISAPNNGIAHLRLVVESQVLGYSK